LIDFLIHLIATGVSEQVHRGRRRRVLSGLLVGSVVVALFVYFFIHDGDGDVVQGWVFAGAIGGAIVGAVLGSLSGSAPRERELPNLKIRHGPNNDR
jgi:hypothetical protein